MAVDMMPGQFGLPMVGESLSFLRNPYEFVKQRYERYGPVFKTHFAGNRTAVLVGAEANRYVLLTNPRNFLSRVGYDFIYPLFGDGLLLIDGDLHDRIRRMMSPAFHARALRNYLDRINQVVAAEFAGWGNQGLKAFYPEARRIIFLLASSLLVGTDSGLHYRELEHWWGDFGRGTGGALPINLPFTTYGKALRARSKIDAMLRQIIAERRGHESIDALGLLTNERAEGGATFTEDQLVAQAKNLIFAAHETTASAISWMLVELSQHPEHLERMKAELGADDRNAPIMFEDLKQKPFTDAFLMETMRLHTPAGLHIRGAKETFAFGGYTIPAGWSVMLTPVFVHRMAQYFANPEQFDPDRFLAPRDEAAKTPLAWTGFGAGPRICIGEGLARMEIKALLTALLRRFDLQVLPKQDFSTIQIPTARPKSDVLFRYQAR